MARNHVWRYTLRLFHTFALFEQIRKSDAKREANSNVVMKRRAVGVQGSVYSSSLVVFAGLKNRCFLMSV